MTNPTSLDLKANPLILEWFNTQKHLRSMLPFIAKRLWEDYEDEMMSRDTLINLIAKHLSTRFGRIHETIIRHKIPRDLERLGIIERYDEKNRLINVYHVEWLYWRKKHKAKLKSTIGYLIRSGNYNAKKLCLLYFLEDPIRHDIISYVVKRGYFHVPFSVLLERMKENILNIPSEDVKRKCLKILEKTLEHIQYIKKRKRILKKNFERSWLSMLLVFGQICDEHFRITYDSEVDDVIITFNLEKLKKDSIVLGKPIEITIKDFANILYEILANYIINKNYVRDLLRIGRIPDIALDEIADELRRRTGLDYNKQVECIKRLGQLGIIRYYYGGISVTERAPYLHWINLTRWSRDKVLRIIMSKHKNT